MTDDEIILHEIRRAEAERKLRSLPAEALETGWVRETQIEAVVDAVVAMMYGPDDAATAHARHVGEWCARIARALPYGPDPSIARRVGVLAEADPAALERIAELRHLAPHVAGHQRFAMETDEEPRVLSLIVSVASYFDARIAAEDRSPGSILREMLRAADPSTKAIVQALFDAVSPHKSAAA